MQRESFGSVRIIFPAYSREQLIERLKADIAGLASELPLRRAVLFGSWARGRATAFSDIDLLVVYNGPRRQDAFAFVRERLALRGVEPHVYTEDEAQTLCSTLERMIKGGVDLLS